MIGRIAAIALLTGCGTTRGAEPPEYPHLPPIDAPAEPTTVAPACVVPPPATEPPSVLIAHEQPAPPPPPGPGGRRVIVLDAMDDYGPLHVSRVAPDGTRTYIAPGSDPRLGPDGAIVYAEQGADGSLSRAGRLGGFGAPLPFANGPFTRDGRHQLVARGACFELEGEEPCALDLFEDDPEMRGTAIAHVPVEVTSSSRPRLFLSEDTAILGACIYERERPRYLRIDRARGTRTETPIAGSCRAFTDRGDAVLTVRHEDGISEITRASEERATVLSTSVRAEGAVFDRCGTAVYVVGPMLENPRRTRVERIDLASGEPTVLAEAATDATPFERLSLDDRGWLLVSSDPSGEAARAWLVPIGGGDRVEHTLEGRIFDVTLGP